MTNNYLFNKLAKGMAVLFFLTGSEAMAQKVGNSCTTTAAFNMTSGDQGSGKSTQIPAKKSLEVLDFNRGWFKVQFGKKVGFVKASVLNKNCKDSGGNVQKKELQKEEALSKKEQGIDLSSMDAAKTTSRSAAEQGPAAAPTITPAQLRQEKQRAAIGDSLDDTLAACEELLDLADPESMDTAVKIQNCADHYWEKAKELFFCSEDFNTPKAKQDECRKDMEAAQAKTLELYDQILADYKSFPDYDEVLYSAGLYRVELEKHNQAIKHFKDIIQYYGDSKRVSDAWFQLGEYYFNVENSARKALGSYQKAAEQTGTFIYPFSVYKQGWCYINTGEWDKAKERFKSTISLTCAPGNEFSKSWAGLCKDGLRDYVRAYSNIGESKLAMEDFKKIGGKQNYRSMMENLGLLYIDQGKHNDVTVAFNDLLNDDPNDIRNPIFNAYLVESANAVGNKANVVKAVKTLAESYKKARKLAENSKGDEETLKKVQKSLNEATDIAENTVRKVAYEYAKEGRSKGNLEVMNYSREVYRDYLSIFPDTKHLFEMTFMYAELLYDIAEKTNDDKKYAATMDEAATNYISVVKMRPNPETDMEKKIVEAAASSAVHALSAVVEYEEKIHPVKVKGTQEVAIPEIYQKLIDACLTYIKYRPNGDDIVGIRYKMARIYYLFNHYDKAAPAFHDIVYNHPTDPVACYAANLTIDIYNGQANYAKLQELTREYINNKELSCGEKERAAFAVIEVKATFMLAQALEQKEEFLAAADAYMDFYKRYPNSEYAVLAVSNAAVCYDKGSKIEDAINTRLYLINKLANHPHADKDLIRDTHHDIAATYDRIADFANAAEYYESFVAAYPKDKRSNDAIYNAGIYREVLKQYGKAEKNRWLYIEKYNKNMEDGAQVYFSICEARETAAAEYEESIKKADKKDRSDMRKVALKKWENANDCYYNYLQVKGYQKVNGALDRQCYGQYRRAEILRQHIKNTKGAREIYDFIIKEWAKGWEEQAKKEHANRCAAAYAERRFKDLNWATNKYKEMTISELNPTSPTKIKNFQDSIKAKTKERERLKALYQKVAEIGVAEWSLAALYQIGEMAYDEIQKVLEAPLPKYLYGEVVDDDMKETFKYQLEEMSEPLKADAIEAFQLAADKASELGVYNKWSMKALDRLQEYGEFPMVAEMELPPIPGEINLRRLSFITDTKKQNPGEYVPITLKVPEPVPAPACVPAEGVECPPPDANGEAAPAAGAQETAESSAPAAKVEE